MLIRALCVDARLIDHADSLGASARYGDGDVQWLTAGDGIVHAEMFPLLKRSQTNPVDFFQIWLNLPAARKRTTPYFSMLWRDAIPVVEVPDAHGLKTRVKVVAGRYRDAQAPPPPPDSWAAEAANDVGIWHIRMPAGSTWTMPSTAPSTHRVLYVVRGPGLDVAGEPVESRHKLVFDPTKEVTLSSPRGSSELLLLQGRPIGESVARYGPFVMNSAGEIRQAYMDYHRTQFGGWPWKRDDPVHGDQAQRFARRPGHEIERPG